MNELHSWMTLNERDYDGVECVCQWVCVDLYFHGMTNNFQVDCPLISWMCTDLFQRFLELYKNKANGLSV